MIWNLGDMKTFLRENPRAKLEDFAKKYKVTKQAVSCRLKRMGLNWQEYKNEAIKEHLERYIEEHPNLTREQIERDFNLKYESVRAEAAKYGIKLKTVRKRKIPKEEIEKFLSKRTNATIHECADYFGVSYNAMFNGLKHYNLTTKRTKKRGREKVSVILEESKVRNYLEENLGITVSKLAEHFKVNYATMKKYLDKYVINLSLYRGITIKKEKIEELINENPNITITEMAKHFKVSNYIIKKHLSLYGIKLLGNRVKFSKEDLEEYIKKNPKANQADIARHFGVSHSTINKYKKRYGLQMPKIIAIEKFKDYMEKHPDASYKQIARDLNISVTAVYKYKRMCIDREEVKVELSREELLTKIVQILKSVKGVSIKGLKIFLESKGIKVTEKEILEYQNKLLQEKERYRRKVIRRDYESK